MNDFHYAARVLMRSPGFTAVAVLTLALGIGLNTTLFGIINPLLFRPLPVRDQASVIWIASASSKPGGPQGNLTYPDLLDYRTRHDVLADAAAFTDSTMALRAGDRAIRLTGQVVTANYFSVLGVAPALGRAFLPEEDERPGAHPVVVISEALWRRELAAAATAVGRTVALNGAPYTIVGVAPRGFAGVDVFSPADVWVPISMARDAIPDLGNPTSRESWWLHGIGRLAPGTSIQSARAALATVAAGIAREYPASHAGATVHVDAFHGAEPEDRAGVMQVSALLIGVTSMVLLIACANVAGLLLSRAAARQREIGIRLALGGTRARLARQFFAESLILATTAAALSLLLSMWTTDAAVRMMDLPGHLDARLDWRVIAFTIATAMAAALVFGLTPALRAAGQDLLPSLRSEPGGDARPQRSRLRRAIVAGQLAICLSLLISAGLFLRALVTASRTDVGFAYADRVSVSMDLRMQRYASAKAAAFYREIVARVQALPGVRSVTLAENVPMGGRVSVYGLQFPGRPQDPDTRPPRASVNRVWTGYFETLGMAILRGRDFTSADLRATPEVAVISETMASRFWSGQDAIGQQFSLGLRERPLTVVGVVRDTLVDEFNERPWSSVYVPYSPAPGALSLIVWTGAAPAETIRGIERAVHEMDADLPLFRSMPLAAFIAERMDAERTLSRMLAVCGAVALLLASLGLYGVMAYAVTRRQREIGVRVALGATRADIARLFVGEGMRLSIFGAAAGLLPAIAVSRLLASELVGVQTLDPPTFAATTAVLAFVSLCAAWLPARRALRVDPMTAMRSE
jgi:putative ABC transport system permease protein